MSSRITGVSPSGRGTARRHDQRAGTRHGIDFEQAQALWLDPHLREAPARSATEPRWMVIGMLDGKHWTAFITYRGECERIISVRRSRPDEVARYEDHG